MKKALLLLLLLVSFLGFSQMNKHVVVNNCEIIKLALSEEKIIDYLHTELPQRSKLYLIKNEFCNLNEKLGKINIETVDEQVAVDKKNYIKITSLKIVKEGKILELYYPIEGAVFVVKLDYNDKITYVDVIEK